MASIPYVTQKTALGRTLNIIKRLKDGEVNVLKTRWDRLNKIMLGGFRFKQNVLIAGVSGHGKSWMLQFIESDLLDPNLNGDFPQPICLLHFGFEMPIEDEMLRLLSLKTKTTYSKLISAYERLDDDVFNEVVEEARKIKDIERNHIFYVERPGSRHEVYETIRDIYVKYPDHKIIFTIDHTLLVKISDESTEIELLAAVSKMLIDLKQEFGTLGIVLGQLTQDLISPARRAQPSLHYPTQSDIHGSKQMIHAIDWMFAVVMPGKYMQGTSYGMLKLPVKSMLYMHLLKGRFLEEEGSPIIQLENRLSTESNFIQIDNTDLTNSNQNQTYGITNR